MLFLIIVWGEDGGDVTWPSIQGRGYTHIGAQEIEIGTAAASAGFLVLGLTDDVNVVVFGFAQAIVKLKDLGLAADGSAAYVTQLPHYQLRLVFISRSEKRSLSIYIFPIWINALLSQPLDTFFCGLIRLIRMIHHFGEEISQHLFSLTQNVQMSTFERLD